VASDTSLVFNLLGKDKISGVLGVIKNAFRSTASTAEEAMDKASVSTERLDKQIDETKRHLAELDAEFAATGDKTLFGKISRDRSLLTNLEKIRKEIENNNQAVGGSNDVEAEAEGRMRALASAFSAGAGQLGQLGSTVGSVTSSIWGIVAALAAVVAGLVAVGPGVALAGGALGSLPGLLSGGIAGIGALKLGLTGLSSEYKRLTTVTGGSGGAAQAQQQVTAATRGVQSAVEQLAKAERDVTTAQQDALAAQLAITAARETASKRIRDENLSLQTAQLDQKDAVQAVTDAQNALNAAKGSGNTGEIAKAQEAYDRAVIAAEEAKNKVDDLTEAQKLNTKTGVEGSAEVVQAKKQEADARQRVADSIQAEHDAELRLQDARTNLANTQKKQAGGGGGAGQQITELAPSARAFLNTILGLRPAFTALRLDVQQQLFAGLAGPIQRLAEKWLPQLHTTLDRFGSTFNGIAKTAISTAGKKTFISDMAAGADAVRRALGEVGKAVAGPVLDAFGRLARASAPFVEKLGHLLAGALTTFSKWIQKADESGKLKSFFEGAATTLGKIGTIGGQIVTIVGKILGLFYPSAKSGGDSVLDSANKALGKISAWLDKPDNQAGLRAVADAWKAIGIWLIHAAVKVAKFAAAFEFGIGWVIYKGGQLVGWVMSLPGKIGNAAASIGNAFVAPFKWAFNEIARLWNGTAGQLHFTVPSWVPFFGGDGFSMPQIPYLAQGGTVTTAGMAVVGERGPELVSLARGAQVTPLQPGRGGIAVVEFDFRGLDNEFGRLLQKTIRTRPGVQATVKGLLN
jgi:hypothetical protein